MRSDLVVAAFLVRALRGEPLRDRRRRLAGARVRVRRGPRRRARARARSRSRRTARTTSKPNEAISIRQLAETVGELVGDIEVTFGPSRPGDYRAQRVSSERGARRARLGARSSTSRRACARRSSGTASDDRRAGDVHRGASPDGGRRRVGSRSCRRTTRSRRSRPCSTSSYPLVDELVVVDDGSTDDTRARDRGVAARATTAASCSCTT